MTFDPLADERVAEGVTVPRGDNGNPWIVPRDCAEGEEYTRASAMSDFLVRNVHGLKTWEMRYLAQALGRNPDLAAEAAAQHYSTGPLTGTLPIEDRRRAGRELDDIIARALERERIHEAANAGTAVHKATEPGEPDPRGMHPLIEGAVREYHKLTAGLERVASEVFVVNDTLRVAGTFDSGYLSPEFPGVVVVGDTKTGKNYHQAEFEIQMACYARGEVYLGPPKEEPAGWYPPVADQRLTFEEFFGVPVNLHTGYLVHVPLEGKPKPRIVKLDLMRGWDMACLCAQIRDGRALFDKIGIGEKVDANGLAIAEMQRLVGLLLEWHTYGVGTGAAEWSPPDEEFREKAMALYRRFQHIWPQEYTDEIKRRLS